jgi:hypothetical protein
LNWRAEILIRDLRFLETVKNLTPRTREVMRSIEQRGAENASRREFNELQIAVERISNGRQQRRGMKEWERRREEKLLKQLHNAERIGK